MPGRGSSGTEQCWQEGAEEFNRGRYWHAHECWEVGWRRMPQGPARDRVQALIQACAVFVHLGKGRPGPALRLACRALEKLATTAEPRPAKQIGAPRAAPAPFQGAPILRGAPIEVPGLVPALGRIAAALAREPAAIPPAWERAARALQARVIRRD